MKNCIEFAVTRLTQFIMTMGIMEIIDILNHFSVLTDVVTLDKACLKTEELSEMRHVATESQNMYTLMAPSRVVEHLVELLTNPASPEEAYKINSALKTLCFRKFGNTTKFYELISEALHRRLLFTKLSQIYAPLIEEVKTNKDLLILLINNKLIDMDHLQELSGCQEYHVRVAHYIIHNINSYKKLSRFNYYMQNWCRDTNMVDLLMEVSFDIEMYQMKKITDKIVEDSKQSACLIY